MVQGISKLWMSTKEILYPRRCPVCDDPVKQRGEAICIGCLEKLQLLAPPWCMKCGKKVEENQMLCTSCENGGHVFERNRALYEYQSVAGAIYRLKYQGRQEYADFFGSEMAKYLAEYIKYCEPDAIVPIPLHQKRMRSRGYNQAALLAQSLGKEMKIPVHKDLLKRVKSTVPLKTLNPLQRQNNLKKAFIISKNDVKLKSVILIDDIFTTGATLDEAARTLKATGIRDVYCVTLACGAGV